MHALTRLSTAPIRQATIIATKFHVEPNYLNDARYPLRHNINILIPNYNTEANQNNFSLICFINYWLGNWYVLL